MDIKLKATDDELIDKFKNLWIRKDVADLLEIDLFTSKKEPHNKLYNL